MGSEVARQSKETGWAVDMPAGQDLRLRQRFPYRVILYRSAGEGRVEAERERVGSECFYCISEQPFSPLEQLDCEITIPGDQFGCSREEGLVLRCRVEVLRIVAKGLEVGFGVACRLIEDYSISET